MKKLVSACAAATLVVLGTAIPADAASRTLYDSGTQQSAANNLQHARMTYAPARTVYRLKVQNLSKRRTQAIVRFYRPGYDLMITTKYVNGTRRTVARHNDYGANQTTRFFRGVRVRWDFRNDVITIINRRFLAGRSARLAAYTVTKGWMHGPHTSPDDYVFARIRRG